MIKPSINEVLNQIDNRYYLVVTVAKRSRELIDGATPYEKENVILKSAIKILIN